MIFQTAWVVLVLLVTILWPGSREVYAELQKSERFGTEMQASFQYLLSDFSGPVPSQWARLAFDPIHQETYTLNRGFNEIRVFNPQGMEIFVFGGDGDVVSAVDIASGDNGEIFVLPRDIRTQGIHVHNYRGAFQSAISLHGLPEHVAGFRPDRMEYQGGLFYLLDTRALQIVVIRSDGSFLRIFDLAADFDRMADEQDPEKKKSLALEINGFCVGPDGRMYLTAPTLFSAFRLNLDGSLEPFGDSGSGPGKFGVVSGIAVDHSGNVYVADRLRSVVMIFDETFNFLSEFGYRGGRSEDMIVPDDLVIDTVANRVLVSQAANKGVGVYKISALNRR